MAPTHEPERDLSCAHPRIDQTFDSRTVDRRFLIALEIEMGRVYDDARQRHYSVDEFRAAFRTGVHAVQVRRGHPGAGLIEDWCNFHQPEFDAIAEKHRSMPHFVNSIARRVLLRADLPKLMAREFEHPETQAILNDIRTLVFHRETDDQNEEAS